MDKDSGAAAPARGDNRINLKVFADGDSTLDVTNLEVEVGPEAAQQAGTKLGWAAGVFIPVLLNIWGVIMFLRLGWVAGQAGLIGGTLVITLSNVVTGITALSLCAICTNGLVKGGGAYYLISRALGPTFGGAIGLLFFIAQAVAMSLYTIGFAETITDIMQRGGNDPFTGSFENDLRVIGIGVNTMLLLVALVGVGWYAKCQIALLVILIVAMVSVVSGAFFPEIPSTSETRDGGFVGFDDAPSNTGAAYIVDNVVGEKQDFITVFSVFFPAVTGIMAGANMSGDLKRPSHAIPKGTLLGIVVTYFSYIALLWIVGSVSLRCFDPDASSPSNSLCLAADFGSKAFANRIGTETDLGGLYFNRIIMRNLSLWAPLVFAGIFAATLSSALASLVGAPRILQAVARDRLFPWKALNYFSQLPPLANPAEEDTRPSPEPRRGYFLTFIIASGCVLIGKLDLVAPIISNFFMIAYAFTNYACFAASMAKTPGWRPSFKYFNPYLSLFGSLLCLVIMFLSNWLYALVSVILAAFIYKYLDMHMPDKHWGPANDAQRYLRAIKAMGDLSRVKTDAAGNVHVKAYRPQYLVLHEQAMGPDKAQFSPSLSLITKFFKGRGIIMHASVVTTDRTLSTRQRVTEALNTRHAVNQAIATEFRLNSRQRDLVHTEAVVCNSFRDGVATLLQTSGLGGLRPNTLVFDYPKTLMSSNYDQVLAFEQVIADCMACKKAVAIVRDDKSMWVDNYRRPGMPRRVISSVTSTASAAPRLVDVWWLADEGGLAILVPHLFLQNEQLKGSRMRVFTTGSANEADPDMTWMAEKRVAKLSSYLHQLRFQAEPISKKMDAWEISSQSLENFNALFPGLVSRADIDSLPRPKEGGANSRAPTPPTAADAAETKPTPAVAPDTSGDDATAGADGASAAVDGAGAGVTAAPATEAKPASPGTVPPFMQDDRFSMAVDEHNRANLTFDSIRLIRHAELIRQDSDKADLIFIVMPPTKTNYPTGLLSAWLETLTRNLPPVVLIRGNGTSVVTSRS